MKRTLLLSLSSFLMHVALFPAGKSLHASSLDHHAERSAVVVGVDQQEPIENDNRIKVTVIRSIENQIVKLLVTYPREAETIKITMHNLLGRQILQLPEQTALRGEETYQIDTRDLPNGHYFIVIEALGQRITKKVVLSR